MKICSIRRVTIAFVLFTGPLFLAAVFSGSDVALATQAWAQSSQKQAPRKLPGLSQRLLKSLSSVTELAQPPEGSGKKPDFRKALQELIQIEKRCTKCNPYELSQIYNYIAWVSYSLNDVNNALRYYQRVLGQSPNIPWGLELQTRYTLAQLNFAEEKYPQALKLLREWMKVSSLITAQAYQFEATICYQMGDKSCAGKQITKAIEMIEAKGKIAKEPWYNLQRAIFFEREQYSSALKNLQKLVRHYPKKSYWRQLAGVYGILEKEDKQFAVMETAYLMGALDREQELINLAYMYLNEDVPYKAAKVMEKGLADKVIAPTSKNYQTLAIAHRSAKDIDDAIPAMEKAAQKSDNGDMYGDLISLYLDTDKPDKAVEAGKKALGKGKLRDADAVNLNIGIAYIELKKYDNAIKSFDKVLRNRAVKDSVRNFAVNWKKHAENEKYREEQLATAL